MKEIAIYGFGGFGREVACLIRKINEQQPRWKFIGYFDDGHAAGERNTYGEVLGDMETLNGWPRELDVAFAIGSAPVLRRLTARVVNPRVGFPNLIAPDVLFFDHDSVTMGRGNLLTFGCRLSCGVTLGDFNILNGCVSLGHEASLGDCNVLFPETRLSGEVRVGDGNFFGARSFVMQGVRIGCDTRIGAGSFVLRRTRDGNLYAGNPATIVKI